MLLYCKGSGRNRGAKIVTITVEVPEEITRYLSEQGRDIARGALELMLLEAYREHKLTTAQLRRLLGFESRYELDGFLKQREVWLDYTIEDLDQEAEVTQPFIARQGENVRHDPE
jgi:Uncharacterised protein family (UPF0175)